MKQYDSYKDSGIDWIGKIPSHWEICRSKYVFSYKKGKNPKYFSDGVVTQHVYLTMDYLRGRDKILYIKDVSDLYYIPDKELLLLWDGSNAGEFVLSKKGYLSSTMAHIVFNSKILKSYGIYYSKKIEYKLREATIGMGIPHVDSQELENSIFILPPLSEQKAIADFLDEKCGLIDKALSLKEQQIEKLQELRQTIIHQAVTRGLDKNVELKDSGIDWIGKIPKHWEVKKLKYVAEINRNSLSEETPKTFEFDYVDIGSVSLEKGIEKIEHFLFENAPSRARRIAKNGDTIISTVRTYLKAIDYIENEKSKFIYSTGFAILSPYENLIPKYLSFFVKNETFTEQVTLNSKGMSYPAINSTDLGRLILVIPPLLEQAAIVAYLDQKTAEIDKAIDLKQSEITQLKSYKSSLINEVVTGKVKVSK